MKATFLDETGGSRHFEMGCYGIGVTRIVGAAIEQNHDERGIVFPEPIAPFQVALIPIGYGKNPAGARGGRLDLSRADRAPVSRSCSTTATSGRA